MPIDTTALNSSDRGSIYFTGRRVSGLPRDGRLFRQRFMQILNVLGNGTTPCLSLQNCGISDQSAESILF